MPDPKACNKIADPAARERCKNYEGEFAEPAGSNPGAQGGGPLGSKPWSQFAPISQKKGGGGFGGRGGY